MLKSARVEEGNKMPTLIKLKITYYWVSFLIGETYHGVDVQLHIPWFLVELNLESAPEHYSQ